MVVGLALVLVMLAALSLIAISGLMSYRELVNDPDFSVNRGVRRADLIDGISTLYGPLKSPGDPDLARYKRPDFSYDVKELRAQIDKYRLQLDKVPPTLDTDVTGRMLAKIATELETLNQMHERGEDVIAMRDKVTELILAAQRVPPSQGRRIRKLQDAREAYYSKFWWVCGTTAVVVLLFLGLVGLGYRWVFAPIRALHQGASRVAQGDFDYRVQLSTNDEMSELADSFNQMTARFQEIANDLDRQVQERSKQLVRSERLAGVGFLAAGVAHEINNPLTAITWSAESLRSRIDGLLEHAEGEDVEVARQYLQMIGREAKRCQQITARLLDFSRSQETTRSRNDLTGIISEVLTLIGHMSKFCDRNVVFQHSQPCHLEVNGPEIKQVVLNLVANALESVDTGGTVTIELVEQTDEITITFNDDGCGMTPDVIENLFEPFFTKKRTGKGTGLGLSISHRIISDHGGTIEATSDGQDRGSTFSVRLPRSAGQEQAAA